MPQQFAPPFLQTRRRRPAVTVPSDAPGLVPFQPQGGGTAMAAPPAPSPSIEPFSARGAAIRSNTLGARRAAQFAGATPTPYPIALNDIRGNPTGKFDNSGAARRQAFVDGKNQEADLLAQGAGYGQNYFMGRDFATDANARAGEMNDAQVGMVDSLSGVNRADADRINAETKQIVPANANLLQAQGGLTRAQTGQVQTETDRARRLIPSTVAGAEQDVVNKRTLGQYIGPQIEQDLTERKAGLPAKVTRATNEAELVKAQADAVRNQSTAAADPTGGIQAQKARYDLAKQMAEDEYQDQSTLRYLTQFLPFVDDIKGRGELTQKHLSQLTPAQPNKGNSKPPTVTTPQEYAALASGTQYYDPQGKLRMKP